MRHARAVLPAAALLAAGAGGVALASGGPPPVTPPDPPPYTIVASGAGERPVVRPSRRTNGTIDRAVRAARARALPAAIAAARREARALGSAAGLAAGDVVAVRRDVTPPGYWNPDDGRFGPGVWCGRIYAGHRTVRRPDGTTRRVARYRRGCPVPKTATARLTVTFAATPR
jgi:hypothetical protein